MLSYDEDDDEDDYDGGYSDSDEYGFGFGFGGGRYGGSDSESDYGSDDSDAILRRLVSSKEGPAYTKYDEPKYRKEILAVLKTVGEARTGLEFAHGGTVPEDTRIPLITVNGVGRIAFPLLDAQVDALRKVAVVAPYGAGIGKTVVDTKVRDTWKIEASKVKISGKDWDKHLSAMVDQSCAALGLSASDLKVEARLHDLLLYDKGGHFKKHRDTEKEPGMFGTLIVQLPAEHTGGTLVVEHAGQSRIFEFSKDSAEECYFAAFYADCEHTLQPLLSGHRLALSTLFAPPMVRPRLLKITRLRNSKASSRLRRKAGSKTPKRPCVSFYP